MFGAIFAALAVTVLGIMGISPVGKEIMPPAGFFAGIAGLIGYILYAQRRATALVKEEANLSRQDAERAFERLSASPALTTGVSLRWRARTYFGFIFVMIATAAGAAVGWAERSWLVLALSGFTFMWAAKTLLARLAEPEVLRVGPTGIEDPIRFGLIPWQDIQSVSLHEYEIKGTKAAALLIGVRDPETYSQRLGPLARFWVRAETLGFSDGIRFELQALDMAPLALFRLIRAFHERVLPAGAISDMDNYYRVDLEGGKFKEIMADLEKTFAGAIPLSGAPITRHKELMARMDALLKADNERMSRSRARAEKMKWTTILAIVIVLLIALLAGTSVFGR